MAPATASNSRSYRRCQL